jgi:hypothetical protein
LGLFFFGKFHLAKVFKKNKLNMGPLLKVKLNFDFGLNPKRLELLLNTSQLVDFSSKYASFRIGLKYDFE